MMSLDVITNHNPLNMNRLPILYAKIYVLTTLPPVQTTAHQYTVSSDPALLFHDSKNYQPSDHP